MLKIIFGLVLVTQLAQAVTPHEKALHLLNRFSFGPRPGEVETLEKKGEKGLRDWLELQIQSAGKPQPKIDDKLKELGSLKLSSAELLKLYPKKDKKDSDKMKPDVSDSEGAPKDILKELAIQKIVRASESENQLEEVLLDFWFNHFNVYFDKGEVRYELTSFERDSLRPYIFGKFSQLLLATAKSPAMLFYLDNHRSKKGQINENYARELMELHTLGVDGGYTQADIQETARALTGWGIEKPKEVSAFRFAKGQHDREAKKIMGLSLPAGGGIDDGEKLIAYLAIHPSTAHFIARKLAVKFISDTPSEKTVEQLAQVFIKTGGDLKEVYREILKTDEFWNSKAIGAKIKTPFEYFISSVRVLNADVLPQTSRLNGLKSFFDQSGESLYRCLPPTGYKATADAWVNPGAMVNRINLSLKLARNQIPQVDFDKNKLLQPILQNKYKEEIDLINWMNLHIFNSVIASGTLTKLDTLADDSRLYQDEVKRELPLHYFQIEKILGLMLSTPEFQRR